MGVRSCGRCSSPMFVTGAGVASTFCACSSGSIFSGVEVCESERDDSVIPVALRLLSSVASGGWFPEATVLRAASK